MTVICKLCDTPREVIKRPVREDCRCRSCASTEQVHTYILAKFRVCGECGNKKRVFTDAEANCKLCRDCINKAATGFQRVCIDCGDVKDVDNERDSKAPRCKICSAKEIARNRIGTISKVPKKVYWYFCANCPKVQVKRTKQGGTFCQECNRKQPRRKNRIPLPHFDFKEMKMTPMIRHVRVCPHCPEDNNAKFVQSAKLAGIRPCAKHKYTDNPEALAIKEKKRIATRDKNAVDGKHRKKYAKSDKQKIKQSRLKAKKVSKAAIEKAIQLNREHRSFHENEKKEIPTQKLSDKEMMAQYKGGVTVILDTIKMSDLGLGCKTGFCKAD